MNQLKKSKMIAFGPIPSRRLGISLGINNIVSQKVCSYSCIYCQIGKTGHMSVQRKTFYEPERLLEHIETHLNKLDQDHTPEYLTFVANGEPTLDKNLGKEIKLLKRFGIPIAVITNASLIDKEEVQNDLMEADWVSVKVDAVDERIWNTINRPSTDLDNKKILAGIQRFAAVYKGKLQTETMLLEGYNDSTQILKQNASFIAQLHPAHAYLSIPTRPPAMKSIKPVSEEKITEAWQIYQEAGLNTELLTGFEGTNAGTTGNIFEDILNITAVHPLREDTLAELLKKENAEAAIVDSLIHQGLIKVVNYQHKKYYTRHYHY
jgi:wyosine [tRNA(Phe)-imidazoG37] synthetase (radical SAM superfamily)